MAMAQVGGDVRTRAGPPPGSCDGSHPFVPYLAARDAPALTHAFPARTPMMPWRGQREIPKDLIAGRFERFEATPRAGATVAYVHVPFCVSRCLFCGFYRNPHDPARLRRYADLLIADLARAATRRMVADGPPLSAVYLGGGTPTALSAPDIARVVAALRTHLPLAADCEITLEARPFGFDDEKIDAALEAGVNRISLGVQSFDTTVRRRLGRKLDREAVVATLRRLLARDRAAIVIDLIYGLPGQTGAVWQADLATAADLGLDGLDAYALSVWPNSPLAQAVAAGKTLALPTLADQARAYAAARNFFVARGWRRLAMAHVARTVRERNLYNRLIKSDATCLAFGPGAGGSGFGASWSTFSDFDAWAGAVEAGAAPIARIGELPALHAADTLIASSLERGELDLSAVETLCPGFRAAATPLLRSWEASGLACVDAGALRTSIAGDFWMTTLARGLRTACELAEKAAA